MVAGLARSDLHTSYRAGAGRLREHALVFGSHVIAIDSIGSVTLVERGRSWWLALLGLIIAGGAASQVPLYGVIAWAGVGVGALAIITNMLVPVDRHLSIGTSDGHITTINSNNSAFLHRMLDLLTEKINSRNATLLAAFDISSGIVHLVVPPQPAAAARTAQAAHELLVTASDVVANDTGEDAAASNDSAIRPLRSAADVDETLFANDPEPANKLRSITETAPEAPRVVVSTLQEPAHDPLLDGPSVARPRKVDHPEWMNRPDGSYGNGDNQSGGARWLLPVLLLAIGAGGAVAAWLVLGQSKGGPAIALLSPPQPTPIENASFAETLPDAPAAPVAAIPAPEPITPAATPAASQAFTTSAPRILEPAEGVNLSGGPQRVRMAWSSLSEARTHIVEVQTFDEAAQSWIETRGPGRLTVGSDNEVAETIPTIGRWRWRVRGVAETGEQSQFSPWSAFTLSE